MSAPLPEPWLRGPVRGIPDLLQPAAHALIMAREDSLAAAAGLTVSQLWLKPGGAASPGFHLLHLAGSTDRLLTYARGDPLSEQRRAALAEENTLPEPRPALEELSGRWQAAVERALAQLADTPERELNQPRYVGRARLPSTVLGLLFHTAEHAQRHAGQLVTTARIIRGLRLA